MDLQQFIMDHVTPQLVPGEQVQALGCLRHPRNRTIIGVANDYTEYLAAATNLRLILLWTSGGRFYPVQPKAECRQVYQWWYQELDRVEVTPGPGAIGTHYTRMVLVPHAPLGPEDGDRMLDVFPEVEGLPGQAALHQTFPNWLSQQVAAGAFPMDAERQARVQHHQAMAAQAPPRRGPLLVVALIVGGLVLLGLGAFALYFMFGSGGGGSSAQPTEPVRYRPPPAATKTPEAKKTKKTKKTAEPEPEPAPTVKATAKKPCKSCAIGDLMCQMNCIKD